MIASQDSLDLRNPRKRRIGLTSAVAPPPNAEIKHRKTIFRNQMTCFLFSVWILTIRVVYGKPEGATLVQQIIQGRVVRLHCTGTKLDRGAQSGTKCVTTGQ